MATPPKGFIDLASAYKTPDQTFVNIIGIVVDLMPPMLTKTGQHTISFRLLDYRLSMAAEGAQGLTCRSFIDDPEHLPKVRNIGDVVLFRNIKMMTFDYSRVAVTNWTTGCIVFPGAAIPDKSFAIAYVNNQKLERLGIPKDVDNFNLQEQDYVIRIKEDMKPRVNQSLGKVATRPLPQDSTTEVSAAKRARTSGGPYGFGPKFSLIEDLRDWQFADLVGFVVKCYPAQYGGCDLYISDYTANEALRPYAAPEQEGEISRERDGDAFGYSEVAMKNWPGPYGHLVMKINVKPPHAAFAANSVKEGNIVHLRNVKRRISPAGGFLEGDMWPDHIHPDQIKIRLVRDTSGPECQSMIKRKEKYWVTRDTRLLQNAPGQAAVPQKKSKTAKKREKEMEKKERREKAKAKAASTEDHNQHIRCMHEEGLSVMKVKDILDEENTWHVNETPEGLRYPLPFINARYCANVRVVDYQPTALEDFAVLDTGGDSGSHPDLWTLEGSPKYEWAFSLLLEDASSSRESAEENRVWVHVQHDEAQFLLGDVPDPDDLRHRPALLRQLKEKLFILWGNLEEKGEGDALSNKAFRCCIEEYGIEMEDDISSGHSGAGSCKRWLRMHRMFGVTIS